MKILLIAILGCSCAYGQSLLDSTKYDESKMEITTQQTTDHEFKTPDKLASGKWGCQVGRLGIMAKDGGLNDPTTNEYFIPDKTQQYGAMQDAGLMLGATGKRMYWYTCKVAK